MVFLSSTIVAGSFVLEVGRVLDPALKRNVETIYLFKFIFKFVYESYLLLNLRQMIYEFSLKYIKIYFVIMLIKLRCNERNLSGSVQISIINTIICKFLRFFLPMLNKFYIHTYCTRAQLGIFQKVAQILQKCRQPRLAEEKKI